MNYKQLWATATATAEIKFFAYCKTKKPNVASNTAYPLT